MSAEHFNVHRIIGRGGFGEVFPCQKRDTGHVYVLLKRKNRRRRKREGGGKLETERTSESIEIVLVLCTFSAAVYFETFSKRITVCPFFI